jgi:acetaldehyde dehydrogenase/alcohol dehydrogenase
MVESESEMVESLNGEERMWRFLAPHIKFGKNALEYLKDLDGKKAVIVTDPGVRKLGFADKVADFLKDAKIKSTIFDGVEADPSTEVVERGVKVLREFQPDWIIALGGGSSIDTAKTVWILYERPDLTIEDLKAPVRVLGLRNKARLIAIPTTAGTGADSTWAMVITDSKTRTKMEFAFDEVIADVAILDPELTYKLPKQITADTGLDALVHAFEGYTNLWKNDFCDGMGMWAIKLIFEYLPRAYSKGEKDKIAREKMINAATMAGLSFGNSQAGFCHSMGHSLGAIFHVPHGRAVAIALPYVVQFNAKKIPELYADIAKAVGIPEFSRDTMIKRLVEKIKSLMKELNEPLSIKKLGIKREDFEKNLDELIEKAMKDSCTPANPRDVSKEECKKLYEYAYEGRDIDF